MKNVIRALAIVALLPMAAYAQNTLDKEVNAELDKLYQESGVSTSNAPAQGTQVNVNVQAQPQAQATATQSTEQKQAAALEANAQVLKQPTTVIEAAPVSESKADQIRKARQEAELATEMKIVEKLEQSRMEDERRRAETLFGDKFNSLQNTEASANNNATTTVTTQVQGDNATITPVVVQEVKAEAVAPAVQAAPAVAPVVVEAKAQEPGLDREAVRGEIKAALADMKEEAKPEPAKDQTYVGVLLGGGEYPDVANIRTNGGVGVVIGKSFDNLVLEGSLTYSVFEVEQRDGGVTTCCAYYPRMTEMAQYNTSLAAKYQFALGKIRPSVGVLASYTYRNYRDTQFGYSGTASSQAVDLGATAGADLQVNEKFSIGADLKYMFFNLWNRADNTLQESFVFERPYADRRVETLSYWQLSVSGRMTF